MGSGSSVAAPQREVSHVSRGKPAEETKTATHEFDSCLPYTNFRDLFTLKNYWKVVRRNERESGKALVSKYEIFIIFFFLFFFSIFNLLFFILISFFSYF